MYARANLKELVKIDESDPKNCGRRFWRWLHCQPWRAMLPLPKEYLASCGFVFEGLGVPFSHLSLPRPRSQDWSCADGSNRRDPMYLGRWHIFLPSEMCLDCTLCNWYLLYTWNMCKYYGPWWLVTLNSFMDCMDCPGSMLCTLTMRTFSGRDGLDLLECQGCNILQSDML